MLTNLGGTDMEQRPNRAAITKKGRERRERKSFTQIRLIFNTKLFFISTWERRAMKVKSSPSLSKLSVKAKT